MTLKKRKWLLIKSQKNQIAVKIAAIQIDVWQLFLCSGVDLNYTLLSIPLVIPTQSLPRT